MREREHQKGIRKAWFGTCKELSSTDQLSIVPTEKVGLFKHTLASGCPFLVTFRVSHPFNNISFSARKPLNPAYPAVISTIGDHIRTRRLDLELMQKEVAERIGVDTDTITNWELNRTVPEIRCYPSIIEFLGYVPFSPGESFLERLKTYRMLKGLSQRQLARELGVDPTTVRKWEAGTSKPMRRMCEQVEEIIESICRTAV